MTDTVESILMAAGSMIAERDRELAERAAEIQSVSASCNRMKLERDEAIEKLKKRGGK
jgi:hypothetical protein